MLVEYTKGEIQKSKDFKKNYDKIKKDKRCDIKILQAVISVKEKLSAEGASTVYLLIYMYYKNRSI